MQPIDPNAYRPLTPEAPPPPGSKWVSTNDHSKKDDEKSWAAEMSRVEERATLQSLRQLERKQKIAEALAKLEHERKGQ